jgi:outer membrane receptor protein involved in Fe transport
LFWSLIQLNTLQYKTSIGAGSVHDVVAVDRPIIGTKCTDGSEKYLSPAGRTRISERRQSILAFNSNLYRKKPSFPSKREGRLLSPITFDPVADAIRLSRLQIAIIATYLAVFVLPCPAQTPAEAGSDQRNDNVASHQSPPSATPTKPVLHTVVTVTGEPLDISLAPASANVVDKERVRDADALNSDDIMRTVPFVNLEQNGSAGSLSTLTIRGGKPNLVLMLIDGIPLNDLTNLLGGAFNFSTLLTPDVERIEVVRGPLSSNYGSEAMSGVINIITKPAEYESEVIAGVEAGSFGTAGLNLRAEGSRGALGYKLSGAFLRV